MTQMTANRPTHHESVCFTSVFVILGLAKESFFFHLYTPEMNNGVRIIIQCIPNRMPSSMQFVSKYSMCTAVLYFDSFARMVFIKATFEHFSGKLSDWIEESAISWSHSNSPIYFKTKLFTWICLIFLLQRSCHMHWKQTKYSPQS